MQQHKHLELLGLKARDSVTGYFGVITTLSFDLYGCIQAVVTPPVGVDGEIKSGNWFDITRLEITSNTPVMERPNFDIGYIAEGRKGCAIKPAM
jgi:hypothetical protein